MRKHDEKRPVPAMDTMHHAHGTACGEDACHDHVHGDECGEDACHEHHHHDMPVGAEHATLFAAGRTILFQPPISAASARCMGEKLFIALSEQYAVMDMVPGHIKGILKAPGGGALSLSATRPGHVDTAVHGDWRQDMPIASLEVTIDILLLLPVTVDEDALFTAFH